MNETAGNERNMKRTLKAILLSVGLCSLPSLCFSAIVYDNSTTALGPQYSPPTPTWEFGDQIKLDINNTTDRILSTFSFSTFVNSSSASVTLRLYANTGVNNSPATTPFYSSEPNPVNNGFGSYDLNPPSGTIVTLPDEFTWTVQFSNLGANESGGLLVYGPPTIGTSLPTFWQKDDTTGVWSPQTLNGISSADFAARVTAVPEPGVLALGGLGALLLAWLGRFRRAPR